MVYYKYIYCLSSFSECGEMLSPFFFLTKLKTFHLGECMPSLVSNSNRKYCKYLLCAVPSYWLTITVTQILINGRITKQESHTVQPNNPYARTPPILLNSVISPVSTVCRELARISKTQIWNIIENVAAE